MIIINYLKAYDRCTESNVNLFPKYFTPISGAYTILQISPKSLMTRRSFDCLFAI